MKNSPSSHVFFHPSLVKAWVDTYLPIRDIKPLFLVAAKGDTTIFLPLVLWKKNWKNAWQRMIVPAGYSDYDYHDPIVNSVITEDDLAEYWQCLICEIKNNFKIVYDRIEITGIRRGVDNIKLFTQDQDICPFCDLTPYDNGDCFLSSLKKSLRGDIRRQIRRMEEKAAVRHNVYKTDEYEGAVKSLAPFLKAHSDRWPNAYKAPGFHENLLKYGLSDGVVHFSELLIGNEIAAWHLGFVDSSRFYYYMPANNPNYNTLSPGKILLFYCVEDSILKRLRIFDHLRGAENYKSGWTDSISHICNMIMENNSCISSIKNTTVSRINPLLGSIKS